MAGCIGLTLPFKKGKDGEPKGSPTQSDRGAVYLIRHKKSRVIDMTVHPILISRVLILTTVFCSSWIKVQLNMVFCKWFF